MNNYNDEPVEISDLQEQYNTGYDDGYNNGYEEGFNNSQNNTLERIDRKLGCIVFVLLVPFIISAILIMSAIATGIGIFDFLSQFL